MIHLERTYTPILLTPDYVKSKTLAFKTDGQNVWNVEIIKVALLEFSYSKCAYCECKLMIESKYVEVEHFEDKSKNPDKVIVWDNLLPSCKRCNASKSSHDVILSPIVNPFLIDPKLHLAFQHYRFEGITDLGENTIEVINLNDPVKAISVRYDIGDGLLNLIALSKERLLAYKEKQITNRLNKLLTVVIEILNHSQPESAYSATCSTILNRSRTFVNVKDELQKLNFWSTEMESLYLNTKEIELNL